MHHKLESTNIMAVQHLPSSLTRSFLELDMQARFSHETGSQGERAVHGLFLQFDMHSDEHSEHSEP